MTKPFTPPDLFPLFAHQGGWDEALMVAGPLFVVGLLLYLANRRVNDQLAADAATSTDLATGEQAEDPTRHGNADSGETSQ